MTVFSADSWPPSLLQPYLQKQSRSKVACFLFHIQGFGHTVSSWAGESVSMGYLKHNWSASPRRRGDRCWAAVTRADHYIGSPLSNRMKYHGRKEWDSASLSKQSQGFEQRTCLSLQPMSLTFTIFPMVAKFRLFPLQANWAGPWKVGGIPNGTNIKEKKVGNDQAICCGMHLLFAVRPSTSLLCKCYSKKKACLEFPLRLTNILLKEKQSKATFV